MSDDFEPCVCGEQTPPCICTCPKPEFVEISARKRQILTTVTRTENYLRDRRIPELLRFFFTKILSQNSLHPEIYLDKLLDHCMYFRAGHGEPPVLYERRHFEAIIKSFDPGQRGWLSPGQIRRLYITVGLPPDDSITDNMPSNEILDKLVETQEIELRSLLSAGMEVDTDDSSSSST